MFLAYIRLAVSFPPAIHFSFASRKLLNNNLFSIHLLNLFELTYDYFLMFTFDRNHTFLSVYIYFDCKDYCSRMTFANEKRIAVKKETINQTNRKHFKNPKINNYFTSQLPLSIPYPNDTSITPSKPQKCTNPKYNVHQSATISHCFQSRKTKNLKQNYNTTSR